MAKDFEGAANKSDEWRMQDKKQKSQKNFGGFTDGNNISLRYPLDLQEGQYYREAIRFGIYERTGVSLKEIGKQFNEAYKTGKAEYDNSDNELVEKQNAFLKDQIKKWDNDYTNYKNVATREAMERGEHAMITPEGDWKNPAQSTIKFFGISQGEFPNGPRRQDLVNKKISTNIGEAGMKVLRAAAEVLSQQTSKSSRLTVDEQKINLIGSIHINMPASVQFNEQVDWQSMDLGMVGAIMKNEAGVMDTVKAGGLSNIGQIVGGSAGLLMSKAMGSSGLAGSLIGAMLGSNSALQGGIEAASNIKANPFKEQTFQGINFRPFDFSFTFRARNEKEVNEIQKIIQAFRGFSKPNFKSGGQGLFEYPKEFRIEFLKLVSTDSNNPLDYEYEINEYLPQIKYCICKGVNTNFTGSGWKSFKNSAPVDITLQLTFQETEIITQEDVFGKTEHGRFAKQGGKF
jgi:hypothetical protein